MKEYAGRRERADRPDRGSRGGKMITIIGTAHISQESVDEVREKILELKPDVIAVELCESRYKGLFEQKDIPLFDLIKSKNSTPFIINVLLSILQRRLGAKVGVKPGKEMLVAIDIAKETGTDFSLIDRNIIITFKRAIGTMSFFEKLRSIKDIAMTSSIEKSDLENKINEMKEEANLGEILDDLKTTSPRIYEVLVKERDAYMAKKLVDLEKRYNNIVAVVGAGHKRGIEKYLHNPETIPDQNALLEIPKKRFSLLKILKYAVPLIIITPFILAVSKGIPIKEPIGKWILINAVPTFLGVVIVGGSIISATVGAVASPLTSLNPMMAAGWFAGATELKIRRVTVNDVSTMFKTTGFKELYKNKAFKVLLVTAMANIGSMIGTSAAFPTIVWPLLKSIFGW